MILLSKTNIYIKTQIDNWDSIKEVRIIPRNNYYVIEVVYEKIEKVIIGDAIASIDPGVNNLATVAFNTNKYKPFIINGRPLKSINQYYNKKKSEIQSKLERDRKDIKSKKISKRLNKLNNKRNEKIRDYIHKSSRLLVNQLVNSHTKILVIGKNVGQKQDSNMSKKNNQNFVNIPIYRFLDMVSYKAKLEGIDVVWQEESYTSKSSFLNSDPLPVYGEKPPEGGYEFSGYRASRGLYKIKGENKYINADLNGALNILRKAIPKAFVDGIEGIAVCPKRLTSAV